MRLLLRPHLFGSALAIVFLTIAQLAFAGETEIESGAAAADDTPAGRFIERKGEGWFWYKDPKEQKPKKPTPETTAPVNV
ncbi:MAG: hypothetical protein Q7T25_03385, partial [Sideroxyarcus sp.]|nr:hypothetical protein [Sideroxyarcus sp.]